MAEAVVSPAFVDAEVGKRTRQAIDGIASDKDYPPAVLGRYFDATLFEGHPYGRAAGGDEASLAQLSRDEIAAFHAEAFDPRAALLVVAGEFDPESVTRDVERAFGALRAPSGGADRGAGAVLADPPPVRGRRVRLIDKPDEASCYFRFGNVGIAFDDPEWPAILLACTVLGGQFTSWLNLALRVDGGLTYGVSASCARRRRRGSFAISSFTPVEHAARAIALAQAQLARIHDEGVDDLTLQLAKNYVRGQFPLSVETADQIAETIARVEAHGLDRSYVDRYLDHIDRATPESVTTAARRAFPRDDDLAFTIIGPAAALLPVARSLGPVTTKGIGEAGF
jgi:DNA-directed RNA polymerase